MLIRKSDTSKLPVWSYWQGEQPPLIQLCHESIARYNSTYRIVGNDDIRAMGGGEVLDFTEGLKAHARSNLVRLWLLQQKGGIWVDSDSICLDSLQSLYAPGYDLVGVYNRFRRKRIGSSGIIATPFYLRQGSPVAQLLLDKCREITQRYVDGKHVRYGMASTGVLSWAYHSTKEPIFRREHWRYNRVPWEKSQKQFLAKRNHNKHEFQEFYNPAACVYHLSKEVINSFAGYSREEILQSKTFVGFLLQKAFSLSPGVTGRAREILSRLPENPTVVEIGVFRGRLSRDLLQQRKDLRLTMVDQWSNHGHDGAELKRRYGEIPFYVKYSPERWERIYRHVVNSNRFAADRINIIRKSSLDAAKDIPDRSCDLVFIDADHTYEAVKADIQAWRPKVKPGGYLAGHDYDAPKEGGIYGVKRAVDEFARDHNATIETGDDYTFFIRQ
jgi:hypothetical protein